MSYIERATQEFLLESFENLDQIDQDLLLLEKQPESEELLSSIFRTLHTLKGSSAFLGFSKLEQLAHAGENLLAKLRDRELSLSQEMITTLLTVVDTLRAALKHIDTHRKEENREYRALIQQLEEVASHTPPLKVEKVAPSSQSATQKKQVGEHTVRVDVALLDHLMNLIEELVLTRNRILQFSTSSSDSEFTHHAARLHLLTSNLQEQVMRTRLQPIDAIWSKFPRLIRDLSANSKKRVVLETVGEGTLIDRKILDTIREPLADIVRSAILERIEPPDVRSQNKKQEEGTLHLQAYQEEDLVFITITDDGCGSNREEIIREIKERIETVNGSLAVQSEEHVGSTWKLSLPLTLGVVPALIVTVQDGQFAIPQTNIVELVRLKKESTRARVEQISDHTFLRLRESLMPLFYLGDLLEYSMGTRTESEQIVIVQAHGVKFGIIVDQIRNNHEIVAKPLSTRLKWIEIFGGTAIMEDGSIALIIDVGALADRAQVHELLREKQEEQKIDQDIEARRTKDTIVVFSDGERGQAAVRLSAVSRLHTVPCTAIEQVGESEVLQYRGSIMPLLRLSQTHNSRANIIVCHHHQKTVGVIVDDFIDVRYAETERTALIREGVTEIIDIGEYIQSTRQGAV